MLNQIAFFAFCWRALHNRARRIPGGCEENIAIWNMSIEQAGNIQKPALSLIDGVPVDSWLGNCLDQGEATLGVK